jgi:hypothetical protein
MKDLNSEHERLMVAVLSVRDGVRAAAGAVLTAQRHEHLRQEALARAFDLCATCSKHLTRILKGGCERRRGLRPRQNVRGQTPWSPT